MESSEAPLAGSVIPYSTNYVQSFVMKVANQTFTIEERTNGLDHVRKIDCPYQHPSLAVESHRTWAYSKDYSDMQVQLAVANRLTERLVVERRE